MLEHSIVFFDEFLDIVSDTVNCYVSESTTDAIRNFGTERMERRESAKIRRMVLQERMSEKYKPPPMKKREKKKDVDPNEKKSRRGTAKSSRREGQSNNLPPRLVAWKKTKHSEYGLV